MNKIIILSFGLFALAINIFSPIIAILFFAVSPLAVFSGERLKAGQETTANSYICHMGIEWINGSDTYISKLGFGQSGHSNHSSKTTSQHHNVHEIQPQKDAHNQHNIHHEHHTNHHQTPKPKQINHTPETQSNQTSNENEERCMIEQVMQFFKHQTYRLNHLLPIFVFLFLTLLVNFSITTNILASYCRHFHLAPHRQAPPHSFC